MAINHLAAGSLVGTIEYQGVAWTLEQIARFDFYANAVRGLLYAISPIFLYGTIGYHTGIPGAVRMERAWNQMSAFFTTSVPNRQVITSSFLDFARATHWDGVVVIDYYWRTSVDHTKTKEQLVVGLTTGSTLRSRCLIMLRYAQRLILDPDIWFCFEVSWVDYQMCRDWFAALDLYTLRRFLTEVPGYGAQNLADLDVIADIADIADT